jgi:hypothetical protein
VQRTSTSPVLRHRFAAAGGDNGREDEGGRLLAAGQVLDDLRDHVARALQHDAVAGPHPQPRDLVPVVQRRVGHDDAADRHRLQPRDRSQLAGAPDLDVDGVQRRLRALGRELVRDRPARRAPDRAQARLPVEPVDLVDDAVDVEGKVRAPGLDRAILSDGLVYIAAEPEPRRDRETPAPERLDERRLRLTGHRRRLAPAMRKEAQRPAGGDVRVLLPERARGRVARVGELARAVAAFREQPLVQGGEGGLLHIHLAPDLEHVRRAVR